MAKLNWMTKGCGVFLLWAAVATALPAQKFSTLLQFDDTDGAFPTAGLIQDAVGNLYGTTQSGGANGEGTIFRITPSGHLTTLYSFCAQTNCTDGSSPNARLVLASNGRFYGTTTSGGILGLGTIFAITSSGKLTTLHSFEDNEGFFPQANMIQASDGKLYGATGNGGAYSYGTIFAVTLSGTLTTVYNFDSTDGSGPSALVQATDGDFYGTTQLGGAFGYGTVFKITPHGTLTTLHSFDNTDGANPVAALVQGADGKFYGTTAYGGAFDDCSRGAACGTVFTITPSGTLTTLHSFDSTDGALPSAALIQGTDGNFYGTTYTGGASDDGTIFKITPSGTLTSLHSFDDADGALPSAALVQGINGGFYGTASEGGAISSCDPPDGCGTVFSLSVRLSPFVETNPTTGKVGAAVKILGSFLTGATSVTFDGTPATSSVNSKSEITTTVPTGATTGAAQVISPRLGTLSSNVPLTARP